MNSKVVHIGRFFGGSFGVAGQPGEVYDYFAVDSDISDACASAHDRPLIAFRSSAEAHERLRVLKLPAPPKPVGRK